MDVEVEMAKVRAKVQRQIDRSALEAEARIFGMTPIGYAMTLDARREAERKAEKERVLAQTRANAEALGRTLRDLHDSFVAMAEGISRGFNKG